MAALITHLVLAQKVKKHLNINGRADLYFVGTVLPDARYLTKIDRNKTHTKGFNFSQLKNEEPFECGFKLHSLVDQVRTEYVKSVGLDKLLPNDIHTNTALKLLEEKVLYCKLLSSQEIINFFNQLYPQEKIFNLDEQSLKKWHSLVIAHLKKQPDGLTQQQFMLAMGMSKTWAKDVLSVVHQIEDNVQIQKLIWDFYHNFEDLVQNH